MSTDEKPPELYTATKMPRRRLIKKHYLFSTRDVIRSIETREQLQSVAVDVWKHIPDASADTRRKIRRALADKERELMTGFRK